MTQNDLLVKAEKRVFRAAFSDGLIDIGIASFTLMFSTAPLLSVYLGDFWSSFVFLPFWGALYLLLRWVRKRYILPRTGSVSFGPERIARLRKAGLIMLVMNIIFLALGAVTFFYHDGPPWLIGLRFSAVMLIFLTMLGYLYDYPAMYVYGILFALGMPLGEWLWSQGLVSHHGVPVIFGTFTVGIFLFGVFKFARLMRTEIPDYEGAPSETGR